MTTASVFQRSRITILVGCIALVVAMALAEPVAAGGARDDSRIPSELWKTYPLDPSEGTARIRTGTGPDGHDVTPPGVGTARPAGTEAGQVNGDGSPSGDPSRTLGLTVLVLSFFGLLVALVLRAVARARNGPEPRPLLGPKGSSPLQLASTSSSREVSGRPSEQTLPGVSLLLTEKGPKMSKRRRNLRMRRADTRPLEPSHEHIQGNDEAATLTPADVSRLASAENDSEVAENSPEVVSEHEAVEDGEVAEVEETTDLTAVVEEVQTVLTSAQEAAASIRLRAEEEADRLRQEAARSAEAEVAEAQQIAEAHRTEAERIRAEAETLAAETRAAAETFAEDLRRSAEGEAARIVEEAQKRLDAAAERTEQAEGESAQRVETLRAEIRRHEQRLESILLILGGMSSQLKELLGRDPESEDITQPSAESLEEVLRPDHSQVG